MSEPAPSIEQYRECLVMLAKTFDDPGMEEFAPDIQLSRALDELATLRARVAEQDAWRVRAEESIINLLTLAASNYLLVCTDICDSQQGAPCNCDAKDFRGAEEQARALLSAGGQP